MLAQRTNSVGSLMSSAVRLALIKPEVSMLAQRTNSVGSLIKKPEVSL